MNKKVIVLIAVFIFSIIFICYQNFQMASNAQIISIFQLIKIGQPIDQIEKAIALSKISHVSIYTYDDGVVQITGPTTIGANNLIISIKSENGFSKQVGLARADEPQSPFFLKDKEADRSSVHGNQLHP